MYGCPVREFIENSGHVSRPSPVRGNPAPGTCHSWPADFLFAQQASSTQEHGLYAIYGSKVEKKTGCSKAAMGRVVEFNPQDR